MSTFDISYFGVSLSVPVIENIHNSLNKELSRKETFIIVLDDLERKHIELDIKEIFGIVDSLSKIENIKVVIVSAADQLPELDMENFKNYQEKAIDRIYTIEEYAEEAPVQILGERIWSVIGGIAKEFQFQNLRTYEKTNLFIREVIDVLGEEIFSDKFTRDDLYRMCFASVFFTIEHKGEMRLLDANDPKSDFMNAYYTESETGVIEYLSNYILRNSFDNDLSKKVFIFIKKWYETGNFSEEIIKKIINSITNHKEKPHNFFSSEDEILDTISNARNYISSLNGTEQIEDIILYLSTAFTWCEVLSVDFGISNEEILSLVSRNISTKIDITKDIYQNVIGSWGIRTESYKANIVVELINERIKIEYYNQLLKQIIVLLEQQTYHEISYLRRLREAIYSISEEPIRDSLLRTINKHNFLFPIPAGQITEQQWTWCHHINKLIREIQQYWGIENYYQDFSSYVHSLEIIKKDRMLQHRVKTLFERHAD